MKTVSSLATYDLAGSDPTAHAYASRPHQESPQDGLSALLLRVAEGDQAALADLYDETSAILFGLLTHMLGRGAAAEEALAEVYSCVWRKAASYSPGGGRPLAWLVSTARECVLRKGRPGAGPDAPPETSGLHEAAAAAAGAGAAEQPSFNAEAERAREALRGLGPERGEALRLCYFSGLRPVEAAFDLSTREARSLVRDALEGFAETLRTPHVKR